MSSSQCFLFVMGAQKECNISVSVTLDCGSWMGIVLSCSCMWCEILYKGITIEVQAGILDVYNGPSLSMRAQRPLFHWIWPCGIEDSPTTTSLMSKRSLSENWLLGCN